MRPPKITEKKPTSLRDLGPGYIKAFVTFIDILGFKNIVCNKTPADINNILDSMKLFSDVPQQRRYPYTQDKHLPMALQFSDSIIRIQPLLEDQGVDILDLFHGEITSLLFSQGILASQGILVRGGMTFGEICANNNKVFGPAFNNAYRIESSLALYPRIVIDGQLCNSSSANPIAKTTKYSNWLSASQNIFEYIERYDDGQWSINYLLHMYLAYSNSNGHGHNMLGAHRDHIANLITETKANSSQEILSKIRWVASYHNRTIERLFHEQLKNSDHPANNLFVELD
jgi:hypothetical protein